MYASGRGRFLGLRQGQAEGLPEDNGDMDECQCCQIW